MHTGVRPGIGHRVLCSCVQQCAGPGTHDAVLTPLLLPIVLLSKAAHQGRPLRRMCRGPFMHQGLCTRHLRQRARHAATRGNRASRAPGRQAELSMTGDAPHTPTHMQRMCAHLSAFGTGAAGPLVLAAGAAAGFSAACVSAFRGSNEGCLGAPGQLVACFLALPSHSMPLHKIVAHAMPYELAKHGLCLHDTCGDMHGVAGSTLRACAAAESVHASLP